MMMMMMMTHTAASTPHSIHGCTQTRVLLLLHKHGALPTILPCKYACARISHCLPRRTLETGVLAAALRNHLQQALRRITPALHADDMILPCMQMTPWS